LVNIKTKRYTMISESCTCIKQSYVVITLWWNERITYILCTDTVHNVCLIVFNATFNNISATSWQSVLLVEETVLPWENHRPVTSHWQTLSHNVVSSTPHHEWGSNSQLWWWYVLIAQVVVNPNTIRSQPQWPPICVLSGVYMNTTIAKWNRHWSKMDHDVDTQYMWLICIVFVLYIC
jgi:hypothetical protein